LYYILHTFPFEILLPHIVVTPTEFDIKTSRIFVVSNVATISRAQPEESIRSEEAEQVSWKPHVVLAVSPTPLWAFSQIWRFNKAQVM
jgi:hypothetical protein